MSRSTAAEGFNGRRAGWLAVAALAVAGCGGTAVVANGASSATSAGYATTPASSGKLKPSAVPLGDGYVSTTPKVGYLDSCTTQFGGAGGAAVNGPWINAQKKTWNYLTKLAVNGSVSWSAASYTVKTVGGKRVFAFNDLPINHTTGVFPIASADPAHAYDQNPNHIAAQSLSWSLAQHPKLAASASCTPLGPIGVLSDGVVLYDALDAQGRDAGAHEVLDRCAGHPDPSSSYHHHDIPPCILSKTRKGRSTLVGYALDGFGIYVEKNAHGVMPTNAQLDACHGRSSKVRFNGKLIRIYHYVATIEYPYTIGCFRGTAISIGHAPAGGAGGGPHGAAPPSGP